MTPAEIKAFAPVLQTLLWVSLILFLLWYFRKEVEVIRKVLTKRVESGSSIEIGPIKLGERLEKIESSLEETKESVEGLLEHQRAMEEEYLKLSDIYDPQATIKDIDNLGRTLKSHARGLGSLSFLREFCKEGVEEKHFYAIGCAIQERPQYDFLPYFRKILNWLSEDNQLRNFRLRVLYKCMQSLDNLIRLDNKRKVRFIEEAERSELRTLLEKLSINKRVIEDDDANGNRGIGSIINKIIQSTKST